MTKHDDNWTDCERPCFEDFVESFGEGDGPDTCEQPHGDYTKCMHLFRGGRWENCPSGGLSPHRENYGPKEADGE